MARGFFSDFLMGLEGGTRGLPQAIQNRERFGFQREQAEVLRERLDRQEKATNWQWKMKDAKERGDTEAVELLFPEGIELGIYSAYEGEPYLPPAPVEPFGDESASLLEDPGDVMAGFEEMTADPYPGVQDRRLRSRMMFMDEETERKQLEQQREDELFGLEFEKLQQSLEIPWISKGNGFYRVVDDKMETMGDWNPSNMIIDFENGVMYEKGTTDIFPLPEGFEKIIEKNPDLASADWSSGLWIDRSGQVHQMDDDARGLIQEVLDERHRKSLELIGFRRSEQEKLAELRGRIRADASQLASEKRAYTDIISDITDNKVSLDGALERYYGALKAAKIPDARQTAQAMTDHFALLALDRVPFSITNKQKDDLAESGYIWAQAEEIKDLLKKPVVVAHVGIIQGSLSDMKKRWTGERNANPDVVRFRFLLADMSDRIQRIRTGAVINESEKASYDDLMGSTLKDAIALGIRMETLQETMQGRKDTVWREGLDNSFGAKARDYIDKIPQYQSISGYRSEGRTVTGMTDEDF